ncbi:MAG: hypothetical protein ACJAR1_000507 [Rubritalea sp.]
MRKKKKLTHMIKMHHNVFTNKSSLLIFDPQFNMKNKFSHKRLALWNHTLLSRKGFALISSLMIMMLLMLVALAMLSLSSTSVRSATVGKGISEAKANARMALMFAIGELQTHTGNDTRITAPADIVESDAPALTGVWRSWEGENHDDAGRPIKPDYSSKTRPNESGDGRFISWLVSGAGSGNSPASPSPSTLVFSSSTVDTIPLLAFGTLGSDLGQVHVKPQFVNDESGAIGWWVSPENQKARLLHPYSPRSDDAAGWSDLAKTHAVPDLKPFGLDAILVDPENHTPDPNNAKITGKAITLDTTEFLADSNPAKPQQSFHDLSTSAVGLLTNSATGGWRKDMSILTEKWDEIYSRYSGGKLPLFRYSPKEGKTSLATKPTVDAYDASQSNLYPWSGYAQFGTRKVTMTYSAACSSWQSLVNYATSYKSIDFDSSSMTGKVPLGWTNIISQARNQNFYNYYHKNEYNPVVARIQLIVQVNAVPESVYDSQNKNTNIYHRLNMRIVPVFTLWNPYNVEISKTVSNPYRRGVDLDIGIGSERSLPGALSFINGTVPHPNIGLDQNYQLINYGNSWTLDGSLTNQDHRLPKNAAKGYNRAHFGDARGFAGWLPLEFTLKPGEAKVFSPAYDTLTWIHKGTRLKEGYATGANFGMAKVPTNQVSTNGNRLLRIPSGRSGGQVHATDKIRFDVKADRHCRIYSDAISNKSGPGVYWTVGPTRPGWAISKEQIDNGGTDKGVDPTQIRSVMASGIDEDWADKYWPSDELEEVQYDVFELVPGGGNPPWTNLYSISFGPRVSFGAGFDSTQKRPTRGLLQSSPFVSNTYSIPEQTANYHPANGAFDFSYHSMTNNSELSPEVGLSGYIVSGFQSGDGLSRLIMAEIPLRPMASIGELQSWDLRAGNPLPPYQYNLIGNSEATPLIQQDGILPDNPQTTDVSANLQHDDAYCANHVLFDDWFFSSIAPQPTTFGKSIGRDIKTVYRDFLQGNERLINRAYRPITEDQKLSSADADKRIGEILESSAGDGWLKVASRFEVEGMFNVNSTSVKAWRALLGHARKQQVAYHTANGIGIDGDTHEHVVSRHSIAADVKAGVDQGLGATFPSGSEYSGFRTLSSEQLDKLAEKIVDQVRKRGPFLSLSEFVNRQLNSDDEDLALAGALQAALYSLSDIDNDDATDSDLDPNKALKDTVNQLSNVTMDPAGNKLGGVGYSFKKASEGVSTHGLPGWIRQADILRPIAPIISVRDDTFTIRAYGDSRDATGAVIARAWCEATVKRRRDFVDQEDAADFIEPPTNAQNVMFGRRYEIISFRWLSEDEV